MICTVDPIVPVHLCSNRRHRQTRSVPARAKAQGITTDLQVLTFLQGSFSSKPEPRDVTAAYHVIYANIVNRLLCRISFYRKCSALTVIQNRRHMDWNTYIHYQLSSAVKDLKCGRTVNALFVCCWWTFRLHARDRHYAFLKSVFQM